MFRGPHLDALDTLHRVMVRRIERRRLFESAVDCQDFVARLGTVVEATGLSVLAWALSALPPVFRDVAKKDKSTDHGLPVFEAGCVTTGNGAAILVSLHSLAGMSGPRGAPGGGLHSLSFLATHDA